ncbi:MAG: hypothetical protein C4K49_03185, partial [Candidatus Thorarchaeota archaeon]
GGYIPGLTGNALSDLEWRTGISAVTGIAWADVIVHARTAVFAAVVTFELLFVWNCRNEHGPVWRTSLAGTKYLFAAVMASVVLTLATIYLPFAQPLFETMSLNLEDWMVILVTSLPALLIPPHIIFGHWRSERNS